MEHSLFPTKKSAQKWARENLRGMWFIQKQSKNSWKLGYYESDVRIIPAWLDPTVNES